MLKSLVDGKNTLLLTPILASIIVSPFFVDSIMFTKFLMLISLTTFLVAQIFAQGNNMMRDKKTVLWPLIVFMISLLLSSLYSEQSFYESFTGVWGRYNGLLTYLAFAVLYISGVLHKFKDLPDRIIQALVFLGFFQISVGILELLKFQVINYLNKDPYTKLTVGNSNFASVLLVMTLIATIITLFNVKPIKTNYRYILLLSTSIHIVLILSTRALQGLICLVFSLVYLGTQIYMEQEFKFKSFKRIYWLYITGFITVSLVYILKNNIVNLNSLYDRFYIWSAAFEMTKENILFGVGPDGFGKWFPLYKQVGTLKYEGTFENYDSAHNIFLNIAANSGILTLLSYILIQIIVAYRFFVLIKLRLLTTSLSALFCIWIVFQLQSLVSIDHIAVSVWGWLVGGAIVGASLPRDHLEFAKNKEINLKSGTVKINRSHKFRIFSTTFTPFIAFCTYMYPTVLSEFQIKESVKFYSYFNEQKTINNLSPNLVSQAKLVNKKLFNAALDLRSEDLRNYASMVLFNSGESQNAFRITYDTLKRFPRSTNARAILGQVYEAQGNAELAQKYYREIIELDPLNQLYKGKIK